jgi:hypothetical protein
MSLVGEGRIRKYGRNVMINVPKSVYTDSIFKFDIEHGEDVRITLTKTSDGRQCLVIEKKQ